MLYLFSVEMYTLLAGPPVLVARDQGACAFFIKNSKSIHKIFHNTVDILISLIYKIFSSDNHYHYQLRKWFY